MAAASFEERFNDVEVPETMHSMELDADETINQVSEQYFEDIITALNLGNVALDIFFEIKYRMLVEPQQSSPEASDDYIQELHFKGVQPLASILRTRNQSNSLTVSFAKYSLLPYTVQAAERLQASTQIAGDT